MKQIRSTAFPIGAGMVVISALGFAVLRFANPDMTAIRAMLTFWPMMVSTAVGAALIVWSMEGWR